jgi:hypothetical protein
MPQKTLLEALAKVPDPRADHRHHPLPAILALALAAVVGGGHDVASDRRVTRAARSAGGTPALTACGVILVRSPPGAIFWGRAPARRRAHPLGA